MDVLGPDVTADVEAMTARWSAAERDALGERAVALVKAGAPPAAALLIAVGVLLDD